MLKFKDINLYCTSLFVYKSINNHIDSNMFSLRLNARYNLRQNNLLDIPLMRSNQSQSSILYHGVKVWNNLPSNIREKSTVESFKKSLKDLLLNKYEQLLN